MNSLSLEVPPDFYRKMPRYEALARGARDVAIPIRSRKSSIFQGWEVCWQGEGGGMKATRLMRGLLKWMPIGKDYVRAYGLMQKLRDCPAARSANL